MSRRRPALGLQDAPTGGDHFWRGRKERELKGCLNPSGAANSREGGALWVGFSPDGLLGGQK